MTKWAKDGAVIHTELVLKFNCSICGTFKTESGGLNQWFEDEAVRKHAQEKHGGLQTYGGKR